MLKNCVSKLHARLKVPSKIQPLKIVVEKYLSNDVSSISNPHTDCTQLLQQTKKTSQQNPFAGHQRSVKVSDDVSWQDKIGLH